MKNTFNNVNVGVLSIVNVPNQNSLMLQIPSDPPPLPWR